jgi:hypothetical protein
MSWEIAGTMPRRRRFSGTDFRVTGSVPNFLRTKAAPFHTLIHDGDHNSIEN